MSPRKPKNTLDDLDKKILDAIYQWLDKHGLPPTVREIQQAVGASSTSVVDYHLRRLERLEFIVREASDKRKARNIRLHPRLARPRNVDATETTADWASLAAQGRARAARKETRKPRDLGRNLPVTPASRVVSLPLAGRIVASEPIPAFPEGYTADDTIEIPQAFLPRNTEGLYALEVSGNSMIDALIGDGDIVVLKETKEATPGEMVAVWLKHTNESTLKKYQPVYDARQERLEKIILKPANPTMQPIEVDDPAQVEIMGKVVLVIRPTDGSIRRPRSKGA